MEHLLTTQDLDMRNKTNAFSGYTINSSQIAAVSNRKAQIIDNSVVVIRQFEFPKI
jgi:hypothetical protein